MLTKNRVKIPYGLIFSPEYRKSVSKWRKEDMQASLQALMDNFLRDRDSYSATLLLQKIVWFKMLTVEAIEFDGDKILFTDKKSPVSKTPPLPTRPEV